MMAITCTCKSKHAFVVLDVSFLPKTKLNTCTGLKISSPMAYMKLCCGFFYVSYELGFVQFLSFFYIVIWFFLGGIDMVLKMS
jgi:hypothetical protein